MVARRVTLFEAEGWGYEAGGPPFWHYYRDGESLCGVSVRYPPSPKHGFGGETNSQSTYGHPANCWICQQQRQKEQST